MPAGASVAGVLLLDTASPAPLHRQLYEGLRRAILGRQLRAGRRLPSTRVLAAELAVSRNTVLAAFDQLLAEGYLEGKAGSGTYVTHSLPDDSLKAPPRTPARSRSPAGSVPPSRRARDLPQVPPALLGPVRPFRTGPALDLFPSDLWARIASRRWRRATTDQLAYGDSAGYRPLREAVATYLRESRAVRCEPDQVLIVNGGQQALSLAASVLADPGEAAWIEDPAYVGAERALRAAGLRIVAVPLDGEGLDVAAALARRAPAPRLIYVTPSHQYPLGMTMGLARRLELLECARRVGAWVLEDDYDSEYRYSSRPLASLQGLDGDGRTVYLGTFSKVLVPSIRLGYLVVPPALVDSFVRQRWISDRHCSTLEQAVLSEFIAGGHLERHIRRMRPVYAERQAALVAATRAHLEGVLDAQPREAGLHLVGWLRSGLAEAEAVRRARSVGIDLLPLSATAIGTPLPPGLLLGYAAHAEGAILEGARALHRAVSRTKRVPARR